MDNKDSYHIIQARHKQTDLEELVSKYEFFILRCASDSTGKYISKHDDEWSVALECRQPLRSVYRRIYAICKVDYQAAAD